MFGCRKDEHYFDVDEDKHTLVFSQTGLKFHQSWLFGPHFIDHLAANYLGGERSDGTIIIESSCPVIPSVLIRMLIVWYVLLAQCIT